MEKTMQVKVDLHIHVDLHENKKDLIKIFKLAEKEKIKKLAFLEHNSLKYIKALQEIIAEKGGIGRYYTGQFFCAFEMGVVIDAGHINSDGTNYDGNISHILVYMPIKDAITLSEKSDLFVRDLEKDYRDEYKTIIKLIKEKDKNKKLTLPTIEELSSMKKQTIIKDLYAWIVFDEKRKNEYKNVFELNDEQIENASLFVRELHQKVGNALYYIPNFIVSVSNLIKKVRKYSSSAKIIIAHPAYMQDFFDKKYYLDSLLSMKEVVPGRRNFDGIEVMYFKNTIEDNKFSKDYASKNNLIGTAGSDSYPFEKEMYFILNGQKYFFKPKLGRSIGMAYDLKKVKIKEKRNKLFIKTKSKSGILEVDENLFNDIAYDL